MRRTQDDLTPTEKLNLFPEEIINLYYNNPIVNRHIKEYQLGHISFYADCLTKIILALEQQNRELFNKVINVTPIIYNITPKDLK